MTFKEFEEKCNELGIYELDFKFTNFIKYYTKSKNKLRSIAKTHERNQMKGRYPCLKPTQWRRNKIGRAPIQRDVSFDLK